MPLPGDVHGDTDDLRPEAGADALELNPNPPAREMDQLLHTGEIQTVSLFAMAMEAMGHSAISFTGGQIQMITDSVHSKARIKSIGADRIRMEAGLAPLIRTRLL